MLDRNLSEKLQLDPKLTFESDITSARQSESTIIIIISHISQLLIAFDIVNMSPYKQCLSKIYDTFVKYNILYLF